MEETVHNKKQLWQSRLDACQKSGVSAKQWCAQNHIAYSTYFYWAKNRKQHLILRKEMFPEKRSSHNFPQNRIFLRGHRK